MCFYETRSQTVHNCVVQSVTTISTLYINILTYSRNSLIVYSVLNGFLFSFFLNRISVFIFHICYISKVHRRDIKKGFTLKCTTVHGLNLPNCVFLPEVKVIWKLIKNGQKNIKKRSCYHVQYLQIHSCIKKKKKKIGKTSEVWSIFYEKFSKSCHPFSQTMSHKCCYPFVQCFNI